MPKGVYPRIKKADLEGAKIVYPYEALREIREHLATLVHIRNDLMNHGYTNGTSDPYSNVPSTPTNRETYKTLETQIYNAALTVQTEFNKLHNPLVKESTKAVAFNLDSKVDPVSII